MKLTEIVNSDLAKVVHGFVMKFQDPKEVSDAFGSGTFNQICSEPGNCSMVSEELVHWLHIHGFKQAHTVVAWHAKNHKWLEYAKTQPKDEFNDAHVVVSADKSGQHLIDLTARQFDPEMPFPRFFTLSKFKEEWEEVHEQP